MPELPARPPQESARRTTRDDLAVVLVYATFAGLWILLSDQVMAWLFTDPAALALVSTYKGMAFVAVTSLLLYIMLRRRGGAGERPRLRKGWPLVLLAFAVFAFAAAAMLRDYQYQRDMEVKSLHTIADLKARQIADWLAERRREAEFIDSSNYYPELYRRWREAGDAAAGRELQNRLRHFLHARGFNDVSLLDPNGRVIWSTHAEPHPPHAALLAAVRTAADTRRVARSEPYAEPGRRPKIDFVSPLVGAVAPHTVVLHAHLDGWLYPTLRAWPVPSASGETMIFRRDGDQIVSINDLRHRPGAALAMRLPLAASDLPSARVLRGEVRPGTAVEGNDYRGVAILGVVRAVPDSDWYLVAKIDQSELLANAMRSASWIGIAGLLALVMLAGGQVLIRQRQALTQAENVHEAQTAHLRALNLMAAIANSSQDGIFAQDLEGRFILFNQAAEHVTGRTAAEVMGRNEAAVFPPDLATCLIEDNRAVLDGGVARQFEETLVFPEGERTISTSKSPLFDQDGRVIGLLGISRDITAQKAAERALRESEERLRLLIDHAPVALALFDRDMRYLALSRHWREDFEIGDRDVLGQSHHEVFPDLPEQWKEAHRRGLAGETVASDGDKFERRDGGVLWTRWEVLPWRDAGGDIGGILIQAENITERKQAQDALLESEGRFRALVEQSLAGIYIIQDERFRYVNPGFAVMFGYQSADEIIERIDVAELVMPEDRARVAENVRQRVEGRIDDIHYTFAGRRRDGGRIEVEVHGRRFDYQGRPAVIGLILDVTARKAAEDSLRESELRFHDIVNASADWVWEVDAQGRYSYASESVRDLLGYGPEELLGKTPFDLMPAREAARVAAEFAATAAARKPFRDLDNINRHKDGHLIHVSTNGMPILDATGELLGYRGLDRDITERQRAEQALRASEERYRSLVVNLKEVIFQTDAQGKWTFLNPAWTEVTGFPVEQSLGKLFLDYVHPDDRQRNLDLFEPLIRREKDYCRHTIRYLHQAGGFRWIEVYARLILDEQDGIAGTSGALLDITERKTAEIELIARNDELERFNRATVGRELDMLEMKKTINALSRELGREAPYPLAFMNVEKR